MAINYFEQFVAPGIERNMRQQQLDMAKYQMDKQAAQEQAAAQANAKFGDALAKAFDSGDRIEMQRLAASNPGRMKEIKEIMGMQDEEVAKKTGLVSMQVAAAAKNGDLATAQRVIEENRDYLDQVGIGADEVLQQLQQDPQGLVRQADMLSAIVLGPKEWYKLQSDQRDFDLRVQEMNQRSAEAAANRANAVKVAQMNIDGRIAAAEAKIAADGAKGLDVKDVKGINSDLTSMQKDAESVTRSAKKLEALQADATPYAQLAIVFEYMKALDPTSVVREGEQQMMANTAGIPDQIVNYASKLASGERLNADQIADVVATAKRTANVAIEATNNTTQRYLDTYGDAIPQGQRELFDGRKLKPFEVKQTVREQPEPVQPYIPQQAPTSAYGAAAMGGTGFTTKSGIAFEVE